MKIDQIISLCCKQDALTWSIANKAIIKFIPAKQYTVIVPDSDLLLFEEISDQKFIVKPESIFSKKFQKYISDRLPSGEHEHASWYLQQFIKLELLDQLNENTNAVLWDGDTVPLEPINFIDDDGKLRYFVGTENHHPYFATIKKLFNIDKQVSHSFISQSFPIKSEWFQEFKRVIENRSGRIWYEAVIDAINFTHSNAFSEYETLGNFIANQYSSEISFSDDPWLRLGNSLIGDIRLIHSSSAQKKLAPYKYASFEKWDRAKPAFLKVTLPIFHQKIIEPSLNKFFKYRFTNNFYMKLLQLKGTLKINSGVGIFSCCTVRLECILGYFNLHHKTPKIVDSSNQFVFYKNNINENISEDLFAQRDDIKIDWRGRPILVTKSLDEQQFSNYQEICFREISPFIQKYFSPSKLILSKVELLKKASMIDYDNTCVIRFRGTDKEAETVQPSFNSVLEKALTIQAKYPSIRFAIQTDDQEFRSFIFRSLGDCCFEVETSNWKGWSGNKDYIDFYASIFLLSKCKYIITTSGNGELWMMLFRGHAEGVSQYLEHKEFVYGIPNRSFNPGKTSYWIDN